MHDEVAGLWGSASIEALRGGIVDRAQGCLRGQLVGDALGSMVKFTSAHDIARLYPHGLREIGPSPVHGTIADQPTDDSELALALARSLAAYGQRKLSMPARFNAKPQALVLAALKGSPS